MTDNSRPQKDNNEPQITLEQAIAAWHKEQDEIANKIVADFPQIGETPLPQTMDETTLWLEKYINSEWLLYIKNLAYIEVGSLDTYLAKYIMRQFSLRENRSLRADFRNYVDLPIVFNPRPEEIAQEILLKLWKDLNGITKSSEELFYEFKNKSQKVD